MSIFNRREDAGGMSGKDGQRPWEDEKAKPDGKEPILPILKYLGKLLWGRASPSLQRVEAGKKLKGVLFISPFFLYIAGVTAQFMASGRPTTIEEMQRGTRLPSFNPVKCFAALFTPYGPKAIMLLLAVGVIVALLIWVQYQKRPGVEYDKERNFYYSTSGTYGTAGFMKSGEIDKVLDRYAAPELAQPTGAILGEKDGYVLTLPLDSPLNLHTCVFGASGTMKSRAWSRNRILSAALAGESIIATDSKAELFEDMSEYLKTHRGYDVKVLNLIDPANGNTWSALDGVEDEELLAQTIVDVIITNTGGPRGDHFWDAAEGNLLKGLILYMRHSGAATTLGNVYDIITGVKEKSSIPELMRKCPPGSPALHSFNLFLKSSETVQSSVIIGLGSRLQVLQNPSIVDLVGIPDIDLIQPGKEKTAIFIVTSDQNSTLTFISSLFFSMLFIKLVKFADTQCEGRRLTVPVNLILDEFCNVGLIPDFTKKISTVRSRGINISVIFQSIGQLENRYPDNQYLEILGNADTHIFLGCTDPLTAKFISERAGTASVAIENIMQTKRVFQLTDYTPEYRESRGENKRPLLNPDEVLRLPHDEMLILMRGQKVLRARKFDYTKHPESGKLTHTSIFDYNPRAYVPPEPKGKETHTVSAPPKDNPEEKALEPEARPAGNPADERPEKEPLIKPTKSQLDAGGQQMVLSTDGSPMLVGWAGKTKRKPVQRKPDIR